MDKLKGRENPCTKHGFDYAVDPLEKESKSLITAYKKDGSNGIVIIKAKINKSWEYIPLLWCKRTGGKLHLRRK